MKRALRLEITMFVRLLVIGVIAWFGCARPAAAADPPNFVFFLVDDLGFMDIGANNPDTFYETPNIDRLARDGMRFINAYAANPVCSPTRFSIMTGRYPTRVGATNFFSGAREGRFVPAALNDRMPLDEITLGQALQAAGYRTAFVGKWHLGPSEEFWPDRRGFDISVGSSSAGAPRGSYFAPYKILNIEGPQGEFLTERLADESIRALDELAGRPFLLFHSFYSVHTPLQAPEPLVQKYRQRAKKLEADEEFADEEQVWPTDQPRRVRVVQNHPVYAAMVESMDTAVGRILKKLDDLGVARNTVVVFFSDNGGLSTAEGSPTSNLPLRGGKGWLYEGGIREPLIVRWPGVVKAGSVCDTPVASIDFFPTLLEIAGGEPPTDRPIDGVSIAPLLRGEKMPARDLFWHYPHYSNQGGFPGGAVRRGDYKLIERFEDGRVSLYNLRDDPGERHDLASQMPEKVAQLRAALHEWYKVVSADFLRAKDGRQPWQPE